MYKIHNFTDRFFMSFRCENLEFRWKVPLICWCFVILYEPYRRTNVLQALQYCPVDESTPMDPSNKPYSIILANRYITARGVYRILLPSRQKHF